MPLEIRQKCHCCHEFKPRTDFPSVSVPMSLSRKSGRIWGDFCKECLKVHPELLDPEKTGDDDRKYYPK